MAKIKEGYVVIIDGPSCRVDKNYSIALEELDLSTPQDQSCLAHAVMELLPKEAFEE